MKKLQTLAFAITFCALNVFSHAGNEIKSTADQLNDAKNSKKAVFLVVYKLNDPSTEKAFNISREASAKKAKSTEVISLDISDSKNAQLVNKYRLAGAPVPLIIVIDKNGNVAGGLPLAQATPEALVNIIPSPKLSEVIKGMNEQKTIFLVAYKETMLNKEKAFSACNEAVTKMNNNAIVTKLNIVDKAEAKLINKLKISSLLAEPMICVLNSQGQVIATFNTVKSSDELVKAATVVKKSGGCCPGGSSKGGC